MKAFRTVIEPQQSFSLRLAELWQYRELFYFFTWRDIKVKYKQTTLGLLWAVLQPLALMLLFTLVFSKNLRLYTGVLRYEIFVLSGLVCWGLFYGAVSHAAASILQEARIINKIYFPRLIIPASAILVAVFDFLIAFALFLLACLLYQQPIQLAAIVLFPAAFGLILLAAFGLGTFLAALTVKFRDVRYALPFVLQFLFFATAVVYPVSSVSQPWLKNALALNPVNGGLSLFRAAIGEPLDGTQVWIGLAAAIVLCAAGLSYFRKTEAFFADLA